MPEFEHGNAHDSGDCTSSCEHPDHQYVGDDFTAEELAVLKRRMADGSDHYIPWEEALRMLGIKKTHGPVAL